MAETSSLLAKNAGRVRKHPFAADRLILFSDGLFAVIMTVMAVPLKLTENDVVEGFDLKHFLLEQKYEYLVYIFCFVTTANLWMTHVRLFAFLKYVDDVIIWLNLFALLCATFLPYALSLIMVFMETMPDGFHLAVALGAVPIFFLGLLKTAIMWYSLRSTELLSTELVSLPMRAVKVALYTSFLSSSILAVISVLIGFDTKLLTLSRFCLFATTGFATVTRICFYIVLRCKGNQQYKFLSEPPSRERIEALTDGVFSITATLMLLDFSTQALPSVQSLKQDYNNSIYVALSDNRYIFFSYVVSFVIIGLLWMVQYSMFQLIKIITAPLTLVNLLTLSLTGIIPFTSGVIVIFSEVGQSNEKNLALAVQVAMVVVFLAGITQLLFWAIAVFQNNVVIVGKHYVRTHQLIKTLIIPTASFVVYWVSLDPDYVAVYRIYASVLIMTPFLFIILNLGMYACLHIRARRGTSINDVDTFQKDSIS